MANVSAFPPTAPGIFELKTLPAGTLLKSAAQGDYFAQSGPLFGPLFRYISSHDIRMTVPVEAVVDGAAMYFWVAPDEVAKLRGSANGVEVVPIPERKVASLGGRGGYNRANFEAAQARLLAWLAGQGAVEPAGPAYAVYWNGPLTPWFLREYEIHVPVRPKAVAPRS
ncbi:SOUL heme-binding protein [Lacunisphaera limnophila]|uniref:SOUL heme-binding protein n=1 Tax=Lacunisphaera limnophila TaxID=1838286 RepID=A0A1D8AT92_9BACT|nr:heme-binding protein [Lacunisphaera limnophila]AOS44111.1 SOUL heme-binding protein [Lacunisphaera limnophila]